jgi:hypothetical protein
MNRGAGMDEQRVVDACRDVLRVDLSLDDRLPDLGTQSLLIVELALRLQRDFGADVPLEVFLGGTVRGVVDAVAATGHGTAPG